MQEETSRRDLIAAKRDVLISAIEAEKQVMLAYFTLRFAERRIALDRFFLLLDRSVSEHDPKIIDTALMGILGIIQDNPLRDFEAFKRNMKRQEFIIDL